LIYPKHEVWEGHVEEWAKKWKDSKKKDAQARWVLVQLDGIRNSSNSILRESLGRLVHRIEKEVPDYWMIAELAMAGRLEDEMGKQALKALEEYGLGKGALTIKVIPRPLGEPSGRVQ
jgi:ribosomal protein S25